MRRPRPVALRSVLFHHVADHDSSFTEGLGVRMGVDDFASRIAHLARRYRPVSLDDVRAAVDGAALPRRALLVTFDDAYASVAQTAAPILEDHGVPSVFFVNGGFVDHAELGTDNLVAHALATAGPAAVGEALLEIGASGPASLGHVLATIVPSLDLAGVDRLRSALRARLDHDPVARAAAQGLYLRLDELRGLPASMAIGSHTRTHVRCRALDAAGREAEINGNRALLAALLDRPLHGFSVPYGSAQDFPPPVADAVREAGHDVSFLVEGRLNHGPLVADRILRVSLAGTSTPATFAELEVLPRMRYARDLVRGSA